MNDINKNTKKRIGLIAGNGRFPILFAEGARANNIDVVAVGIKGETSKELEKYVEKFYWTGIAQMGKLINILKKENIVNAVMAGGLTKTNVFAKFMNLNFIPDLKTINLLYKVVKDRQDHSILGAIADELSKDGIELQPATLYVPELLAQAGTLTKRAPSERESVDIKFGWDMAKKIADMNIGQCIVIKERVVMAVEAFEGTNETIKRGSKLGGKGVVVIKLSKQDQDIRFDLPAIGEETIEVLVEAGATALAIEAGKTIILDKDKTVKAADNKKIAIVAI
ncbi:MAG: LpxI family protein [Candidatus Anammoxibacter sp.]